SDGSDENTGLSEGQAWRTLKNVNGRDFEPGDAILFKAGDEWHGQLRFDGHDSGAPGAPVKVDMYGFDERTMDELDYPAIHGMGGSGLDDGGDPIGAPYQGDAAVGPGAGHFWEGESGAVMMVNTAHFEVRHLQVTNDDDFVFANNNPTAMEGTTLTYRTQTYVSNAGLVRYDNATRLIMNARDGFMVLLNADEYHPGGDGFRMDGVVLEDNYIHDVDGLQTHANGENNAGAAFQTGSGQPGQSWNSFFSGAIVVHQVGSNVPGMTINDLRIAGNTMYQVGTMGIATFNFSDHNGFQEFSVPTDRYMKNVYIGYNYMDKVLGGVMDSCNIDGALIEYNVGNRWGWKYPRECAGIYGWMLNNTTFSHNLVSNGPPNSGSGNQLGSNGGDGTAWDIDSGLYNVVHEHNYSFNNGMGTVSYLGRNYGTVFRYNIADRDQRAFIVHGYWDNDFGDQYFVNNVLYFDSTKAAAPGTAQSAYEKAYRFMDTSNAPSARLRRTTTHIYNNLFYDYGDSGAHWFFQGRASTAANNWGRSLWKNNYFYFANGEEPAAANGRGPWELTSPGYGMNAADLAPEANSGNVHTFADPMLEGVGGTERLAALPPGIAPAGEDPLPANAACMDLADPFWRTFKPLPGSPLIDSGVWAPQMGEKDFLGADLYYGAAPDIGAFEYDDGGARTVPNTDFAAGSPNLALNKPATSLFSPGLAYLLTDGMIETEPSGGEPTRCIWNTGTAAPQWVEIDFGRSVSFDTVRIYEWIRSATASGGSPRPAIAYYTYSLWDGEKWEPFCDGAPDVDRAAGATVPLTYIGDVFPEVTASKLRVDFAALGDVAHIREIEVYSAGAGAADYTSTPYASLLPAESFDGEPGAASGSMEIALPAASAFNWVRLEETGGSVEAYSIDVLKGGEWVTVGDGDGIGAFASHLFSDLTADGSAADRLRLSWRGSAPPSFASLGVYLLPGLAGAAGVSVDAPAVLEGRYDVSDSSGDASITDASGNGRDLANSGVELVPDPDGQRGQVLRFGYDESLGERFAPASQATDYLSLDGASHPDGMNGKYSISMWVRPQAAFMQRLAPTNNRNQYTLFTKGADGSETYSAQMAYNGVTGGFQAPHRLIVGGAATRLYPTMWGTTEPSMVAATGRWNHLAFTYDGYYWSAWVNGARAMHVRMGDPYAGEAKPLAAGASDLIIGNRRASNAASNYLAGRSPYFGYMDDIRLYSGVLADSEIRAMSGSADAVTGIGIRRAPAKLAYRAGEKLDAAGLSVTATYASGRARTLGADEYELRGAHFFESGAKAVIVALKGDDTLRAGFVAEVLADGAVYKGILESLAGEAEELAGSGLFTPESAAALA
ncbi:MAG: bacterial Ig-like domain-containing protein, partial [Clostridiales bacterium]|nr:bacterial Ig-like domain-containing protein [Clostridiales bacterium]